MPNIVMGTIKVVAKEDATRIAEELEFRETPDAQAFGDKMHLLYRVGPLDVVQFWPLKKAGHLRSMKRVSIPALTQVSVWTSAGKVTVSTPRSVGGEQLLKTG